MSEQHAMVPYIASFRWYCHWMRGMLSGLDDNLARGEASRLCGVRSKLWCRTTCPSPSGGPVILSVPIVGGASAIKRNLPWSMIVSDHGDWPRNHLGAFEAAYGRTPFYRHLEPDMRRILRDAPEKPLHEVCEGIHLTVCRMLAIPEILAPLRQALADRPSTLREIAKGLSAMIDPEENLLGILSEYGPDTLFSLTE